MEHDLEARDSQPTNNAPHKTRQSLGEQAATGTTDVDKGGDSPKVRPWAIGDPFQHPIPKDGDHWEKCLGLAREYDDGMCDVWKDEIQNLLIFAGLFSGVVTAFTIESQKKLQEEPQERTVLLLTKISAQLANASNTIETLPTIEPFSVASPVVRVNICWFISLTLSLTTVLIGILCLQWLREFQRRPSLPHKEALHLRQVRYEGLYKWHVPNILSALPLLLQAALVLFFAGLLDFLISIHSGVAIPVAVVVGLTFFFLAATTILPALQSVSASFHPSWRQAVPCAYKSPQSWAFFKLVMGVVSSFGPSHLYPKSANWHAHDLEYWKGPDPVLRSLAWIGNTLTKNLTAVRSIYHSLEDLLPINAWRVFCLMADHDHDRLPAFNTTSPLLTELASAKILEHLDMPIGWHDFVLHQIELYVRVMGPGNTFIDSKLVGHHRVNCPPYWLLPAVPVETELQLLNCSVWQLERQTDQEDDQMWTLALALVNNPQRPTELLVILDRLFTTIDSWLAHPDPLNYKRTDNCLRKLVTEFILPAVRNQQVGRVQERLADLTVFRSVLGHLHRLRHRPDVADIFRRSQPEWTEFRTAFQVGIEDNTPSHTPASIRRPHNLPPVTD